MLDTKVEQPRKRQTAKLENGALGRCMWISVAKLKEGRKLGHGRHDTPLGRQIRKREAGARRMRMKIRGDGVHDSKRLCLVERRRYTAAICCHET